MKRTLPALAACILVLSCGRPDITIVSDPIWIEDGASLVKDLEKATGKNLSFMPGAIGSEQAYLEELLASTSGDTLVVSPLFSAALDPAMIDTVGKRTILLGFGRQSESEFSATVLLSRKEAFRQAGEACARMLRDEPEVYGNMATAVFYTGTPYRREEMKSFKNGFSTTAGTGNIEIVEIGSLENSRAVQPFLDKVKRSNAKLVVLAASRLNAVCLEEMARDNRFAIVEEGSWFPVYQESIRGSVEFDIPDLLETVIALPFEELSDTVVEAVFAQK